jgi:hypothetical protein
MNLRDAEKEYVFPKTRMSHRLAGRRGDKLGRSTVLSKEEVEAGGEDPGDGGVGLSTWQEGPHSHHQRLSGPPGQDNQVNIGTN